MLRFYISLLSWTKSIVCASVGPWSTSGTNERKAAQLGPLSMEISVNKMTETTDFPWREGRRRAFAGNSFSIFFMNSVGMHHLFQNMANYTFLKCQYTSQNRHSELEIGFRKWSDFSLPWASSSANEGAARARICPQVLIIVQCLPVMSQSPQGAFLVHSCVWD